MPPEDSAHPEQEAGDEPLDAVVYDIHPALVERPAYPYARPASRTPASAIDLDEQNGDNPFHVRPEDLYRPRPTFTFPVTQPARYKVPTRFGMSAILGITTALALLFGGLRLLGADPGVYLFFGLQTIVICIVQMFCGETPRMASSLTGAVVMPLFVILGAYFADRRPDLFGMACLLVMCVPAGAFVGYLTGTCAAGVFLVMEALEPYLQGQRPVPAAASPAGTPGG